MLSLLFLNKDAFVVCNCYSYLPIWRWWQQR